MSNKIVLKNEKGRIVKVRHSFKGAQRRTKSEFKEECDINNIMKKFNQTGQLPGMIQKNPQYGDFSDPITYQDALNTVIHAQEQFAGLPAHVRARFANDPQLFLKFATDASNAKEMASLGLMKPEAVERVKSEKAARKAAAKADAEKKSDAGTPAADRQA